MKKYVSSIFAFSCKVLICLLIFSLWSPIIVPILFYFTFADDDMKAQLLWDWNEFYGLVNSAQRLQNEEIPLRFEDKAVLVAKTVSDIGFLWIPIGILWGFSKGLSLLWHRYVGANI
ncbi:MAG: hypothetical protein OXH00_15320 [Candidatus Poribacteria bacterium]|nr:hypothetical protein [Candidatus Poribacteria bacterium]